MKGLQISYSKEIAKELGKIAVWFPGTEVKVGDIIQFPYEAEGLLRKNRPFGSFKKISELKQYGVSYKSPRQSTSPDPYQYTSQNTVETNANIGAGVEAMGGFSKFKAALNLNFKYEGAIYLLAVDCTTTELVDLGEIEKEVNTNGKELPWEETYLVTSVTVAKKALVVQSTSKNAGISIEGEAKIIEAGMASVNAQAKLSIKSTSGDVFIKNWSDDVSIFMDLVKFERKIFGKEVNGEANRTSRNTTPLKLQKINITELLDN